MRSVVRTSLLRIRIRVNRTQNIPITYDDHRSTNDVSPTLRPVHTDVKLIALTFITRSQRNTSLGFSIAVGCICPYLHTPRPRSYGSINTPRPCSYGSINTPCPCIYVSIITPRPCSYVSINTPRPRSCVSINTPRPLSCISAHTHAHFHILPPIRHAPANVHTGLGNV